MKIFTEADNWSLSSSSKSGNSQIEDDADKELLEQQIRDMHMDEDAQYYEFEIKNVADEVNGG